ncbi:hypothetical protein [Brevibacillus centrosporus]|uniref:hypothetical protein n=1 Tax=Brevibacillus centrosporus TaxID=54910 RepID=UPI002E1AE8A8|nr:hypothetical protein [Brevibacillus centrosporus]
MYYITEAEDLVGKQVGFIHAAQFAEAITIVTTDGGIMVLQQLEDETDVFHEARAHMYISNNSWIIDELAGKGVIKKEELQQWKDEKERQRKAAIEQYAKEQEQRERAALKQLYEKYGPEALA